MNLSVSANSKALYQVSQPQVSRKVQIKPSYSTQVPNLDRYSFNKPSIQTAPIKPEIYFDYVKPQPTLPAEPYLDYVHPHIKPYPIYPIHPATPAYPKTPNSAGSGALSANLKAAGIIAGGAAIGGTAGYFISKAVSSSGIPGLIIGAVAGAALPVVGYGLIN